MLFFSLALLGDVACPHYWQQLTAAVLLSFELHSMTLLLEIGESKIREYATWENHFLIFVLLIPESLAINTMEESNFKGIKSLFTFFWILPIELSKFLFETIGGY